MGDRWEEYKKITAESDRMFKEGMELVRASQELHKKSFAMLLELGKGFGDVQPVQD